MSMNRGISETMSIDYSKHSLFGASKAAADLLAQEYGRYFGLPTVSFRGGCLTGSAHAGTELHGFLSCLMICVVKNRPYRVFGYKGKQVRDNIQSFDVFEAFVEFIRAPRYMSLKGGKKAAFFDCSRNKFFSFYTDLHIHFFWSSLCFPSSADCEPMSAPGGGDIIYCAYIDR